MSSSFLILDTTRQSDAPRQYHQTSLLGERGLLVQTVACVPALFVALAPAKALFAALLQAKASAPDTPLKATRANPTFFCCIAAVANDVLCQEASDNETDDKHERKTENPNVEATATAVVIWTTGFRALSSGCWHFIGTVTFFKSFALAFSNEGSNKVTTAKRRLRNFKACNSVARPTDLDTRSECCKLALLCRSRMLSGERALVLKTDGLAQNEQTCF